MSVVEKLAAEGHLTAEQVERIGKSVSDVVKEARTNPAFLKEAQEKLALGFPAWLKPGAARSGFFQTALGHAADIAPYAAGAAILGGAMGAGAQALRAGVGSAHGAVDKANSFRAMMKANPQLSDANPELVQRGYNTLYRFNPEYARDPMVAGTFVQNVVDQERLDIGTVKSLVDARKSIAQTAPRGPDFFSMPPHDVLSKTTPRDGGDTPESAEYRQRVQSAKAERAEYERDRARDEAALAQYRHDVETGNNPD